MPEKGFLDIVLAYNKLEVTNGWKLVLAVLPEYKDKKYAEKVLNETKKNKNIVIIENSLQEMLNELFSNAGVFISANTYESVPIYLINTIGYNLLIIASSIKANVVVCKEYPYYYPPDNIFALNYYIEKVVDNELKFNTFNPQLLCGYNLEKKFHLLLKEVIKICLQKVK
jgi:hypothetical protein